jgi:hypothetical protein
MKSRKYKNQTYWALNMFKKWDSGVWTAIIWLRIGKGGRHL